MKKLVTAFALCAAISAMAVESENVVGYVNRTIDTGNGEFMANIGVCMKPIGVGTGFTVTDSAFGTTFTAGDQLYVFNPGNWDLDTYTYNGVGLGWFVTWSDGTAETIASFVVPVGANVFYTGALTTFKIVGQVEASGTKQVTFTVDENNFMFPICNPFPVDTKFSDIESFVQAGDQIYVFNHINWDLDTYTYNGVGLGWFATWSDGTASTLTDSNAVLFPAGTGGFILPSATRTWSVTVNY